MGVVGLIANPAAGKDIRRIVAAASSVSNMAKVGILRRAAIGAVEGGAALVVIADDHEGIARQALHDLAADVPAERLRMLETPASPSREHTRRIAAEMQSLGAGALVTLGGDGTHRDIATGWLAAPLVPISTGTNNVYPSMIEATVAGYAAAVVATGKRPPESVAHRSKVLHVAGETGSDLALIDIALINEPFVGARAVYDVSTLAELVVTTAESTAIGLSAIAAQLAPVQRDEPGGVHVTFGSGRQVRAAIAPGVYESVSVGSVERLAHGETVALHGPGVVAFDGERDLELASDDRVTVTLRCDGPWVIDPRRALDQGASEPR